ncbi:MAG: shikimate dehydrogenase [Deltaproteobacteria bacterium]|jgi:shikimate dehydrogenase|nr:shikimate dehydrogenase [Deltaproteobacteria bacterium]
MRRVNGVERVFGVCGHPLRQSLSPALFTWLFAEDDIAARYACWETPPEDLAVFMRDFRAQARQGASITLPHKESVIPYLDGLTETARTIGAVNTLFWKDRALLGHNTDLEGFLAPLRACAGPETALVLGAGGAARAALAGLAALGVPRVLVAARDAGKALRLLADFAPSFAAASPLAWEERETVPGAVSGGLWVINATPVGMRGKEEGLSPLSREAFAAASRPEGCLAYDLVYNPLETAFLTAARAAGWTGRDGLDMFVGQAAAQYRLWLGRELPLADARAFLAQRLVA